ncbi:MAG: radical SAM protein [Candidatus Lernaella stagnicola]|nr:radical SAM protein [Candidatus Lernaella stagnicola]
MTRYGDSAQVEYEATADGRRRQVEFWHLCDSDRVFASSPYLRIATFPHLGMLTLAAILRQAGYDAIYRDRAYDTIDGDTVERTIDRRPVFLGIYSNIALKDDVCELISEVRRRDSDLPVLIGGPSHFHADEYFAAGASAVVAGMADEVITELANRLRSGRSLEGVPGTILPGQPWDGSLAPFPEDVDALPFPASDLAPPGRFRNDLAFIQKQPWYVMLASRGCPYRCHFCSRIYPPEIRQYRLRNPELIVAEMRHLHERYATRHIKFQDDTFGGQSAWLREFCERKIAAALPVEWNASSIPVCLQNEPEETYRLMRTAGCTSFHFGLQSSDPEQLRRIGRSPEEPRILTEIIPRLRRAGIYSLVDIIIGLPGENRATIASHAKFFADLPVDMIQVFPLQIVPHTRLARDYPEGHVTELSSGEIDDAVRSITRGFMLKPRTIIRNLGYIVKNNPRYLLTLVRLVPYLARLAFGRYRMARVPGPAVGSEPRK